MLKFIILFLLVILIHSHSYGQGRSEEQPNIVFIVVDDLNDWVGYLGGHKNARTPNLDRLASKSIVYTNAYSTVPLCNPSRISMLTGLHPYATGINNNRQRNLDNEMPYVLTINEHLKMGGYYVAGYGKIYHQGSGDRYWNTYAYLGERPKPAIVPAHGMSVLTNESSTYDWGPVSEDKRNWGDYQIASKVEDLIENYDREAPFFIAAGFRLPHLPRYIPEEYWSEGLNIVDNIPEHLDSDTADLPEIALELGAPWPRLHKEIVKNNKWDESAAGYLSSTAFIDDQVGRILDALEASEFSENTVVIFTSDNGYMLGEKSKWRKNILWLDSMKIPLIIYDPRRNEEQKRVDVPVSLLDIYPTIQNLAHLPERRDLSGKDLLSFVDIEPIDRTIISLIEGGHISAIDTSHHLIKYSEDQGEEFYSYRTDPNEWFNLSGDSVYKDQIQELGQKTLVRQAEIGTIPNPATVTNIEVTYSESLKVKLELSSLSKYFRYKVRFEDEFNVLMQERVLFDPFISVPQELTSRRMIFSAQILTPFKKTEWSTFFIDLDKITSIGSKVNIVFGLEQNYPNPFNGLTNIKYNILIPDNFTIELFDINGKLVRTLVDKYHNTGHYTYRLNTSGLPSGVYFYRIHAHNMGVSQTKKLTLLK